MSSFKSTVTVTTQDNGIVGIELNMKSQKVKFRYDASCDSLISVVHDMFESLGWDELCEKKTVERITSILNNLENNNDIVVMKEFEDNINNKMDLPHKQYSHLRADLLPTAIYPQSSIGSIGSIDFQSSIEPQSSVASNYDYIYPYKSHKMDVLNNTKSKPKQQFLISNAAVIAGPTTIDWNNRKLLMLYPFPCQVLQIFDDTQISVQLAWPYNDIINKYPSILIERDSTEVSNIENEYMKKIRCSDLGYQSIEKIENTFQ